MLLLNAQDVAQAAPSLPEIIDLVEDAYRQDAAGQVEVPAKIGVHPNGKNFLHAMPAWVAGSGALGLKWVSLFPGNSQHGLPDSSALIVLNDPENGLPAALIEGMWVTYARTGACAALAAKYCAKPDPRKLGLVGCGGLGEWSLRALFAAIPSLEEVSVSSARPETRQSFCSRMAGRGFGRLSAVDSAEGAVRGMDIVVSAVPKHVHPPIEGKWWDPGTLVVPLDVTAAWDDETYLMADRLVCDHPENLAHAIQRYRPGLAADSSRITTMQSLVDRGLSPGDRSHGRTLAFMTGIGSLDMVIAWEIFRRAKVLGLGQFFQLY